MCSLSAPQQDRGHVKTFYEAMSEARRDYLIAVLSQEKGHRTKAAMVAGLHRTYFMKLLRVHGLTTLRKFNRGNAAWQSLGQL
jgi:DNA-binding NtrC family response regulator